MAYSPLLRVPLDDSQNNRYGYYNPYAQETESAAGIARSPLETSTPQVASAPIAPVLNGASDTDDQIIAKGGIPDSWYKNLSKPAAPTEKGFVGKLVQALGGGVDTLMGNLKATGNVYMGDYAGVEANAKTAQEQAFNRPKEQQAFGQAMAALPDNPGFIEGVKGMAGAIWEHPQGALQEFVAQAPNSAAVMGGMYAGGAAGSLLGPVGTAVGAIAGGFLGNLGIETGARLMESGADGLTPAEAQQGMSEGALKALGVTGVDVATLGASRWLLGAPSRAASKAIMGSLTKAGVDVADDAAVATAMTTLGVGSEALLQGARAMARSTGRAPLRTLASAALETVGEGSGEYLGEVMATGQGNLKEALLESIMAAPMSAGEIVWAKSDANQPFKLGTALQRATGTDLSDPKAVDNYIATNLPHFAALSLDQDQLGITTKDEAMQALGNPGAPLVQRINAVAGIAADIATRQNLPAVSEAWLAQAKTAMENGETIKVPGYTQPIPAYQQQQQANRQQEKPIVPPPAVATAPQTGPTPPPTPPGTGSGTSGLAPKPIIPNRMEDQQTTRMIPRQSPLEASKQEASTATTTPAPAAPLGGITPDVPAERQAETAPPTTSPFASTPTPERPPFIPTHTTSDGVPVRQIQGNEYETDKLTPQETQGLRVEPKKAAPVAPTTARNDGETYHDWVTRTWTDAQRRPTDGAWDGSTIENTANAAIKPLAKKLDKGGWSTLDALVPKSRSNQDPRPAVSNYLSDLQQLGTAQLAWDNQGNPHYAKADEAVPTWLTTQPDEQVMQTLPDKSASGTQQRMAQNRAAQIATPTEPINVVPAVDATTRRTPDPVAQNAAADLPIVELPIENLQLSKDVPQFKQGANDKGVVEPLGGKFDRTGTAPIQIWERLDGRQEVISGRHRLDLAQRSGETTLPVQVHREADGFDQQQAVALDAKLNIRDGQGKVIDYVDYFKAHNYTPEQASAEGLVERNPGKRSYTIAAKGGDTLIAQIRAGAITDTHAEAIANAAPGDDALQAVALDQMQKGRSPDQALATLQAVKAMAAPAEGGQQVDLFGFDDSQMQTAERMGAIAARKQREISADLQAINGANKNPKLAAKYGVNVDDPESLKAAHAQLKSDKDAWQNWATNPDLMAIVQAELGGAETAPAVPTAPATTTVATQQPTTPTAVKPPPVRGPEARAQVRLDNEIAGLQAQLTKLAPTSTRRSGLQQRLDAALAKRTPPPLTLTPESEADLQAKDAAEQARQQNEAQADAAAETKQQADLAIDDFNLTEINNDPNQPDFFATSQPASPAPPPATATAHVAPTAAPAPSPATNIAVPATDAVAAPPEAPTLAKPPTVKDLEYVDLGKGRNVPAENKGLIQVRINAGDGVIAVGEIRKILGDNSGSPWQTSDGQRHMNLAKAKQHELATKVLPKLRNEGYLAKETAATAQPAVSTPVQATTPAKTEDALSMADKAAIAAKADRDVLQAYPAQRKTYLGQFAGRELKQHEKFVGAAENKFMAGRIRGFAPGMGVEVDNGDGTVTRHMYSSASGNFFPVQTTLYVKTEVATPAAAPAAPTAVEAQKANPAATDQQAEAVTQAETQPAKATWQMSRDEYFQSLQANKERAYRNQEVARLDQDLSILRNLYADEIRADTTQDGIRSKIEHANVGVMRLLDKQEIKGGDQNTFSYAQRKIGELYDRAVSEGKTLPDMVAHERKAETQPAPSKSEPRLLSQELGVPLEDRSAIKVSVLKQLKPRYAEGPHNVVTANGDAVSVAWSGIRHALNAGIPTWQEAVAALHIEPLLQQAQLLEVRPDKTGRTDPKSITLYQTTAKFDGDEHEVTIFVRNHTDGNRYYDHVTIQKKNPAGLTGSAGGTEVASGPAPTLPFAGPDESIGSQSKNNKTLEDARQPAPDNAQYKPTRVTLEMEPEDAQHSPITAAINKANRWVNALSDADYATLDKAMAGSRQAAFPHGAKLNMDPDKVLAIWQQELEKAKKVEPADTATVTNFGEQLPPSRREQARKLSEAMTDEQLASEPLSKIWPLKDVEEITDPFAAAVAHAARAEIPSKPRSGWKLDRWVANVKMLREIASLFVDNKLTRQQFAEHLKQFPTLKEWQSKVLLLEQLDRSQWSRIGTVRELPHASTMKDGVLVTDPAVIVQIDGKSQWFRGNGKATEHLDAIKALLGDAAAEKQMQFEIRVPRDSSLPPYIIKLGDSEKRKLMTFATTAEARDALKNRYAELVQAWEDVKARDNITESDLRTQENLPRTGQDWRQGRDVTTEEFQNTFGFRGGEWGKWVSQGAGRKQRQDFLNQTYDALMDLASIINVPPQALSLNGTLGIAFGARGSGKASAHFEPSNLVINLTKTRGAGSLAHELFHALDNYFSRLRGVTAFTGDQQGFRANNFITHKPEPLMVRKDGKGSPVTRERLAEWRKNSGTSGYLAEDAWMVDPQHPKGVRPEVEERMVALAKALNDSPMLHRAMRLDGRKSSSDGYWSRTLERAARAFENYVILRMHEQGYSNDFLANVIPADKLNKNAGRYPYLLPEEMAPITQAFDDLFATIKTREDAAGNVAIFEDLAGYDIPTGIAEKKTVPSNQGAFDFAPAPTPTVNRSQSRDNFFLRFKHVATGAFRSGLDTVTTPEEVAHLVAPLRKHAQEQFYAVVTDANGKVLDVQLHTKGGRAESMVYPEVLVPAIAAVDGGTQVWFAHNHPSGAIEVSVPDLRINNLLAEKLKAIGIHPSGHIIVGRGTQATFFTEDSGTLAQGITITPLVRNRSIPITERQIRSQPRSQIAAITNPDQAMAFARGLQGSNVLVLLDNKHVPVATLDMTQSEMGMLRKNEQIPRLMQAIDATNAPAALIKSRHEYSATNLMRMLTQVAGTRVIDAIIVNADGTLESKASQGTLGSGAGAWFSKSAQTATPASPTALRQAIARIMKPWANAPQFEVFTGLAEMPPAVQAAYERQRQIKLQADPNAPADYVDAFWHQGKVWINSEAVPDAATLATTLRHETLGHHGLRALFGRELVPILDRVLASQADLVAAKASAYGLDMSKRMDALSAAEEVLAEWAQTRPTMGVIRQLVAMIRAQLRKWGVLNADSLTRDEILREYVIPARGWVERGNAKAGGLADALVPAFMKHQDDDLFPKEFANTRTRVNVYGERRGNISSAGTKITSTVQGLENFWSWYGNGPIDSKGHPVLLYHATNADISAFEIGREGVNNYGIFGDVKTTRSGIFASPQRKFAQEYLRDGQGKNVMPIYMALQNPLDLRNNLMEIDALKLRNSGVSIHEFFISSNSWEMFDNDADGKNSLVSGIKKAGYDGVIISEESPGGDTEGGDTYIAFSPTQIKSAIGNIGTFDGANPDIRFSLSPRQNTTLEGAWNKLNLAPEKQQTLTDQVRTLLSKNWKQAITDFKANSYEGLFDGLINIDRAEQEVGVTDFAKRGYVSTRMAAGIADILWGVLNKGAPEWRNGVLAYKRGTQGLLTTLGNLGHDMRDWLGWMAGNRANQLLAEGREHNLDQAEIDELMALATPAKAQKFMEAKAAYNALNTAMLDVAQQAGLIDPASRAKWESEWYVPFYRQLESEGDTTLLGPHTSRGLSHQSSGIRALKGGAAPTADLLANILTNWTKLIDASLKNHALSQVADNLSGTRFMVDETTKWQQVLVSKPEMIQRLKDSPELVYEMADWLGLPEGDIDYVLAEIKKMTRGEMEKMWTKVAPTAKDIIRVQRNGKNFYYKVLDAGLLRSIESFGFMGFNDPLTRTARSFKRLLTTGVTSMPDFIIRNFVRDAVQAWAINKDGMQFASSAIKGIRKTYGESDAYWDLVFSGGAFQGGYVHGTDPEAAAQMVRRSLGRKGLIPAQIAAHERGVLATKDKVVEVLDKYWEKYRAWGDKAENINRLATYESAIAAGKSPLQAAYEAKDLMDYSLRGNYQLLMRFTDMVPFLNARIQGLGKLGRAGLADPRIIGMKLAKIAAFSVALAMLNGDDDRYKELEDWKKDAYWHFWLGDQHFMIPKPFEIGVLAGTLPERMWNTFVTGNQENDKMWWSVKHNILGTFNFNPIPQVAMPVIENVANRSFFFDRPIENMRDLGQLPANRFDSRTSDTMRVLGSWLGASPKQLEHLTQGYLGTLGVYLMGLSDAMVRWGEGAPEKPSMAVGDWPIVRSFMQGSGPARNTVWATDLFDAFQEVEMIHRTLNDMKKEGRIDQAKALQQQSAAKLRYRPQLLAAKKRLDEIRRQMTAITDSRMTGTMKRQRLDRLTIEKNRLSERVARQITPAF